MGAGKYARMMRRRGQQSFLLDSFITGILFAHSFAKIASSAPIYNCRIQISTNIYDIGYDSDFKVTGSSGAFDTSGIFVSSLSTLLSGSPTVRITRLYDQTDISGSRWMNMNNCDFIYPSLSDWTQLHYWFSSTNGGAINYSVGTVNQPFGYFVRYARLGYNFTNVVYRGSTGGGGTATPSTRGANAANERMQAGSSLDFANATNGPIYNWLFNFNGASSEIYRDNSLHQSGNAGTDSLTDIGQSTNQADRYVDIRFSGLITSTESLALNNFF
jgi:hypothetical protein